MGKSISELKFEYGDILICEDVGVTPSHLTVGKEYPVISGPAIKTDTGSVWGFGIFADTGWPTTSRFSVKGQRLNIQVGKYYQTRDGKKAGPIMFPRSIDAAESGYNFRGVIEGCTRERVWNTEGKHGSYYVANYPDADLVAEWVDEPTMWKDMTPEEKGALLLAQQEGKTIELYIRHKGQWEVVAEPSWAMQSSYRVKPEPVTEYVTLYFDEYGHTASSNADWMVRIKIVDGVAEPTATVERM